MTRTAVYRHYDAQGLLLYVGMSSNPTKRLYQHRCRSDWAHRVVRSEVDWFETREAARSEEARQIRKLQPPMQIAGLNQDIYNTHVFADAFGRKSMSEALGVGVKAISNAVVSGVFPPPWFDTLETLSIERNIECPRDLFAWRRADTSEDAA